jgi:N-acyl-D-aspartate/D-glutamate deacylase
LENKAPALRKKGRLQQGADADITIFDPNTVADRATVDNPAQEAAGIDYVLVMGQVVKSPEGLHKDVLPGQPIKSEI